MGKVGRQNEIALHLILSCKLQKLSSDPEIKGKTTTTTKSPCTQETREGKGCANTLFQSYLYIHLVP